MYNVLSIDFDWILNSYQWLELNKFILDRIKHISKISFIKQHHHILELLPLHSYITNIDHHHDFGYNEEWNHSINEGNWVTYGIKMNKIKGYNWIGNSDSEYADNERIWAGKYLDYYNWGLNFEEIENIKFDMIVFVESFGYRHETKNESELKFFIPWNITKQFIEKYHTNNIIRLNISNNSKWIKNV